MRLTGFDANATDDFRSFDALPSGVYQALIAEAEERPTQKGDGSYLQFQFQVVSGEFEGQYVWSRLNVRNPNPKTVQIAKAELGAICRAVGVPKPDDTAELVGRRLILHVGRRPRADVPGEFTNYVKKYEPPTDPEPLRTTAQAPSEVPF